LGIFFGCHEDVDSTNEIKPGGIHFVRGLSDVFWGAGCAVDFVVLVELETGGESDLLEVERYLVFCALYV
jgi:hypothetical protein